MTRDTYFENNKKLSVTFDGDIVDMLRAKYVMKAYNKYNLLQEAREKGLELLKKLKDIEGILNVRGKGLLVAFDLENRETRDKFSVDLKANGMICNPTGEKSIRLRPNLAVTDEEIETSINIIRRIL
jgi:L-lysine 6-transaminase